MKKIYKSSAVVISLFLVFSLLPVAGHNAVLADYEGEDSELLESVVGKHGEEYAVGELIVKYKGDHKPFRVAKIPTGKSVREAKWEFESRDDVEYAEPNYIAHAFMVPNDPFYSYQWNFSKIGMESAWNVSNGSGVTVAIVDTGVAYENYSQSRKTKYYLAPDLTNTAFVSGYDFVNDDTHPNDDNGHGTLAGLERRRLRPGPRLGRRRAVPQPLLPRGRLLPVLSLPRLPQVGTLDTGNSFQFIGMDSWFLVSWALVRLCAPACSERGSCSFITSFAILYFRFSTMARATVRV